jgi:hypothetical protein
MIYAVNSCNELISCKFMMNSFYKLIVPVHHKFIVPVQIHLGKFNNYEKRNKEIMFTINSYSDNDSIMKFIALWINSLSDMNLSL